MLRAPRRRRRPARAGRLRAGDRPHRRARPGRALRPDRCARGARPPRRRPAHDGYRQPAAHRRRCRRGLPRRARRAALARSGHRHHHAAGPCLPRPASWPPPGPAAPGTSRPAVAVTVLLVAGGMLAAAIGPEAHGPGWVLAGTPFGGPAAGGRRSGGRRMPCAGPAPPTPGSSSGPAPGLSPDQPLGGLQRTTSWRTAALSMSPTNPGGDAHAPPKLPMNTRLSPAKPYWTVMVEAVPSPTCTPST